MDEGGIISLQAVRQPQELPALQKLCCTKVSIEACSVPSFPYSSHKRKNKFEMSFNALRSSVLFEGYVIPLDQGL